jgi:hypothetical protein
VVIVKLSSDSGSSGSTGSSSGDGGSSSRDGASQEGVRLMVFAIAQMRASGLPQPTVTGNLGLRPYLEAESFRGAIHRSFSAAAEAAMRLLLAALPIVGPRFTYQQQMGTRSTAMKLENALFKSMSRIPELVG